MKRMLLAIVLSVASAVVSADVSITIDTLSNQNNEVEFTVSNIEKDSYSNYNGIHVEKNVKGNWKYIRWHLGCPCGGVKCRRVTIDLGPGESRKYTWDKKDSACNTVTRGEYRFKIPGEWNEDTNGIDILGVSSGFTLP